MRRALWLLTPFLAACPIPEFTHPPGPPAITSFTASPFELFSSGPVELTWKTEGADRVVLHGLPEGPLDVASEGQQVVTATRTLDLELRATGPGGEGRSALRVSLLQPGEVSITRFEVSPSEVSADEAVRLAWETKNATRVALSLSTMELIDADAPASGSIILRRDGDFSIEIRAEGFMGPKVGVQTVRINQRAPRIDQFDTSPTVATEPDGARASWRVARADRIEIEESTTLGTRTVLVDETGRGEGSIALSHVLGVHALTLRAINQAGSVAATARAVILPPRPPEILEFTATPQITGFGGSVRLRFGARGAGALVLNFSTGGMLDVTGVQEWTQLFESSQRLRLVASESIFAPVDAPMDAAELDVVVDPSYPTLSLQSATAFIRQGEQFQVDYAAGNATEIRLVDELGTVQEVQNAASGSFVVLSAQQRTYFVEAINAQGTTAAPAPVLIVSDPIIRRFDIPSVARVSRLVRSQWRVENASYGILSASSQADVILATSEIKSGSNAFLALFPEQAFISLTALGPVAVASDPRSLLVLSNISGGFEEEPNDDEATANAPPSPFAYNVQGSLDAPDDTDMFAIGDGADGRPEIRLTGFDDCRTPVHVDLYEEDRNIKLFSFLRRIELPDGCATLDGASVPELGVVRGAVLALVRSESGGIFDHPYGLQVTLGTRTCGDGIIDTTESCDDGNTLARDGCSGCAIEGLDEAEPNDTLETAGSMPLGRGWRGFLTTRDVDWFRFTLSSETPRGQLTLEGALGGACPPAGVRMYREGSLFSEAPRGDCPRIRQPMPPGNYQVEVFSRDVPAGEGRRPYTLILDTGGL